MERVPPRLASREFPGVKTIYCDEAGHSGQNLLDADQPYFVLASNNFGAAEAQEILEVVRSSQTNESKFASLKRSTTGTSRLIRLLSDPRLNTSRIVVDVFHKRYMIASKIIDLVMETLLHERDVDLYRDGANIGASNVLYYSLAPLCGEAAADEFFAAFVALIRDRNPATRNRYLLAVQRAVTSCADDEFREFLEPFGDESQLDTWLDPINPFALEPAIPALFEHIAVWGRRLREPFAVVHDRSKPVVASESFFLELLASVNETPMPVGYDRRQFEFPLRAASLEQGDSKDHPSLQLADLCAGAINHLLKSRPTGTQDALSEAIGALRCPEWVVGAVVPTPDATPEALDTVGGGCNPVDPLVEHLARRRGLL